MVSKDIQYQRIIAATDRFADRASKTFEHFSQLSLATIGGYMWLKTQPKSSELQDALEIIRYVLPALAVVAIIQILSDYKSWRGFRVAEANILERPELQPRWPWSGRLEFIRCGVAIIVGIFGYLWLR